MDTFKIAVLPCWNNHGHQHEFDTIFAEAGFRHEVLSESKESMDDLMSRLHDFDMLIAPPLFHFDRNLGKGYERPYRMADYAEPLKKWISDGGIFIVSDANYDAGIEWLGIFGESFAPPAHSRCFLGPASIDKPYDPLNVFPDVADLGVQWSHFVLGEGTGWRALIKCGHGNPVVLAQEMGEGIVVLDTLRSDRMMTLIDNLRVRQSLRRMGLVVADGVDTLANPVTGANAISIPCRNVRKEPFKGRMHLWIDPEVRESENMGAVPVKDDPVDFVADVELAGGAEGELVLSCEIPPLGNAHVVLTLESGESTLLVFRRDFRFLLPGEVGHLAVPPSVFAVGDDYEIGILAVSPCTAHVVVDGHVAWDDCAGSPRCDSLIHLIRIPQKWLDKAGRYDVVLRPVLSRKAYYEKYGEEETHSFAFRPMAEKESYNIVNLGDSHNSVAEPVKAGSYFGDDLDLLLLNGDIVGDSGSVLNFNTIYKIAGRITKGAVPCVYVRGNHDLTGPVADRIDQFSPTDDGRTYFTFRLGPVWGIVLDAGECTLRGANDPMHHYRLREDEFVKEVFARREWEGARIRIAACHIPIFSTWGSEPGEERGLYEGWNDALRQMGLQAVFSAHYHCSRVELPGGEGNPPSVHICSSRRIEQPRLVFSTGAVVVTEKGVESIVFPDSDGGCEKFEGLER